VISISLLSFGTFKQLEHFLVGIARNEFCPVGITKRILRIRLGTKHTDLKSSSSFAEKLVKKHFFFPGALKKMCATHFCLPKEKTLAAPPPSPSSSSSSSPPLYNEPVARPLPSLREIVSLD
jgi:hypothetical protein